MRVGKCLRRLQNGADGGVQVGERKAVEPCAVQQFHGVVAVAAACAGAVDLHDVRVVELSNDARLLGEPLAPGGLAVAGWGEDLDGDFTVERELKGLPDGSHAALTDFLQKPVVASGEVGWDHGTAGCFGVLALSVFLHLHQYGQKFAELIRPVGVRGDERFHVCDLTAAERNEERFHQILYWRDVAHGLNSE